MKFSRSAAALAACACLALMGCKSDTDTTHTGHSNMGAMKADNAACPFTGRPVNPEMTPVAFQDKKVGFCCNGCSSKWNSMTDAQKTDAWTKAMAAK
ncbi:MAG: hypothetical protein H7210_03460 [Pyrinomonadaceae bacterium]|nr:hypothetical protein [Phycisphaerales bacterium]